MSELREKFEETAIKLKLSRDFTINQFGTYENLNTKTLFNMFSEGNNLINTPKHETVEECIWEVIKTGYGRRITDIQCNNFKTTGLSESLKFDEFKYCPYCGKTIHHGKPEIER